MSVRGVDAATVSDEHGKGTEVLRTSIVHHVGGGDAGYMAFYAETDCYIRYVKVIHETALTDGDIQVDVAALGDSASDVDNISAITDLTSTATYNVQDITITNPRVAKDSLVFFVFTSVAPATATVSAQVGWMPDIWNQNANPRTYLSPD